MSTPHKHAALIHAWADGKEVEYLAESGVWSDVGTLAVWLNGRTYRIKPHRWQAEIDAQKAGKAIQVRKFKDNIWYGFANDQEINFDAMDDEFRIKPEMLRYRLYKWKVGSETYISSCNVESQASRLESPEACFGGWIGDWQEVEA